MLSRKLHKYPFLRLVLFFAGGVFCGDRLFFEGVRISSSVTLLTTAILLFAVLVVCYLTLRSYSFRWLFGTGTYVFFFLAGAEWTNLLLGQVPANYPERETVYRACLTGSPEVKEKSILLPARLLEACDSTLVLSAPKNILLYFPPGSAAKDFRAGDEVIFSARLSPPQENRESGFFNYSRYLTRKGVSATAFISAGHWERIPGEPSFSITRQAGKCRDKLLEVYRDLGFTGDRLAVLSALTVGYKEELSEEICESFSVSGASHILALSGMHIGFLYALIYFLLKRIPGNSRSVNLLRAVTVILLLWVFAFITGLFPSVLRSVIMFSLLAVSQFYTDRVVSLNTLSAAGLGMLLYNPCWLFDVGFQLSFCAVIAILLIHPRLYGALEVRGYFGRQVWSLVTVSVAAQLGTAPLVLFYFSRFSVHFLLTNLVVIPLATVIIYSAVVMLVFTPIPVLSRLLATVTGELIGLLNGFVRGVEKLPFASVDRVWVYPIEVLLIYLLLFLSVVYSVKHRGKHALLVIAVLAVTAGHRVVMTQKDRAYRSIAFYNVRNCPVVHCMASGGDSWLAYADSLPDEKRLRRVMQGYWNKLRLADPAVIRGDYADTRIVCRNNFLSYAGKTVCMVNDDRWRNMKAGKLLPVDYLYLCKGYGGRIEWLTELFSIREVILDSSLPEYRKKALKDECLALGIACTSLSDQHSVVFKTPV